MHMLGKKSPDLRLTRQLYLANAFTALAFLLLVIIIIVTSIYDCPGTQDLVPVHKIIVKCDNPAGPFLPVFSGFHRVHSYHIDRITSGDPALLFLFRYKPSLYFNTG